MLQRKANRGADAQTGARLRRRLIATTDWSSAGGKFEPHLTADDCVPTRREEVQVWFVIRGWMWEMETVAPVWRDSTVWWMDIITWLHVCECVSGDHREQRIVSVWGNNNSPSLCMCLSILSQMCSFNHLCHELCLFWEINIAWCLIIYQLKKRLWVFVWSNN